jgi:6-phosphogluconolactonase
MLDVEVLPDPEAVAERGAEHIAECARSSVEDHGRFTFAVSGGHVPWEMFRHLIGKMPWEKVTIFQVDERIASEDDPERSLRLLKRSLPPGGASDLHAMLVGAHDLEGAAAAYARSLPEQLDLIHLGIGADGHTASLVPGDPVLDVTDRDVALTQPYMGYRRMTLTYPVLNRARHLLWLITGEDKVDALERLRAGDQTIPAGRVSAANAVVIADAAATGAKVVPG